MDLKERKGVSPTVAGNRGWWEAVSWEVGWMCSTRISRGSDQPVEFGIDNFVGRSYAKWIYRAPHMCSSRSHSADLRLERRQKL